MTAVRVAESLKYGLKLFGYFLGVVIVGGGGLALGATLAKSELSTVMSGSLPGAQFAGGAVLGFLGAFVLVTGLFGILYKLVADAVSIGVADGSPAIDIPEEIDLAAPAGTAQASEGRPRTKTGPTGPSPGEQAAHQHGEKQTVPAAREETTNGEPLGEEPGREEPDQAEPARAEPDREEPDRTEPDRTEPSATEETDETTEVAERETVIQPESDPDPAGGSDASGRTSPESEPPTSGGSRAGETGQSPEGAVDGDADAPPEPTPEEIAFGTREDIEETDESHEPTESDEETTKTGSVAGSSASGDPLAEPTDDE
ncbi:MAG: hypothetical protein ACI8XM_001170 [Haloarculaceae archaeon]|jgi:hypothetical protein